MKIKLKKYGECMKCGGYLLAELATRLVTVKSGRARQPWGRRALS